MDPCFASGLRAKQHQPAAASLRMNEREDDRPLLQDRNVMMFIHQFIPMSQHGQGNKDSEGGGLDAISSSVTSLYSFKEGS
jgi:hypothetical protein